MDGFVDGAGRALVTLSVRGEESDAPMDLAAWVDTAFNGELVVPRAAIEQLRLQKSADAVARLADGTEVILETYRCIIEWFNQSRAVEVIQNDGEFALLGVALLREHRVEIDYRSGTVRIT